MANADYRLERAARQHRRAIRAGVKHSLAVALALAAAIAIMYGETLAIERAPISTVACGLAQTADLKRALDSTPVGAVEASGTDAL